MASSELTLSVAAKARYLKSIRGFLTPIFSERFSPEEVQQLVLAVDEACANIIKHGQGWLKPKGRISLEVHESRKKIEVRILNFCREKDVDKIKPRDLDDVKPGGLGTHFIDEVMDSVEFVPDKDGGGRMAMVMTRSIGEKKDNEAQN